MIGKNSEQSKGGNFSFCPFARESMRNRVAPRKRRHSVEKAISLHKGGAVRSDRGGSKAGGVFFSAELGAGGDGVVHHDEVELLLTLLGVDGGEEHATALLTHHLAGGQVDDGD